MAKNVSIQDARKAILKKVSNLKKAKSGFNFNNTIRTMVVRMQSREKLINSDLLWAERAIERSKMLKIKLSSFGKSDPASFSRIIEIYNDISAKDLTAMVKAAEERLAKQLLRCETDEQKAIVSQFHELKTQRELKLKALIKDVLTAEGVIGKTKIKKESIVITNPIESAVISQPIEITE